jgi:Phytanoyl-CoA dioxygenase (PhyH)
MTETQLDHPAPAARGRPLDLSDDAFGWLRPSDSLTVDPEALRARLDEDGYLFVPGLLGREAVRTGRLELLARVHSAGGLDGAYPLEDGVLRPGADQLGLWQSYPSTSEAVLSVVRGERMLSFFAEILGGEVRPYDFVWLRDQPPSHGVKPHCDLVFMGRGTHQVLTCWTPFGDIPLGGGGLMLLEDSHRTAAVRAADYLRQDVDSYCSNGPNAGAVRDGTMHWEHWDQPAPGREWEGELAEDAVALREEWGGRWLTAPWFRMGDVLIFTMGTVHAGTDNATNRLRLSTDSRYQRADAAIDERWVAGANGEAPVGHGVGAKRGKIC